MAVRLAEPQSTSSIASLHDCGLAVQALNVLPDHCASDVSELAERIGADKLELIQWARADISFARLVASKVMRTS